MKKDYGDKKLFIELTYVLGEHYNCLIFQCVPTTYVTDIKEPYFDIYNKQVACQLALPLLNISN